MKNFEAQQAEQVAVIGAGPAGLSAAEVLMQAGFQVHVYDAMPSAARKFLLAGKSGMNLTHAEAIDTFVTRYGPRRQQVEPLIRQFDPQALREWVHGLGIDTFVGTSQRVFPTDMKAAPLLRAWLKRLREGGVRFHMRHRWIGWNETGQLRFATAEGEHQVDAQAVLLALGGASWARLGSNGAWVPLLGEKGVPIAALQPSNCGFDVPWSEHFKTRFAGHPLSSVALACTDQQGTRHQRKGQFVVTETGIEGSLVYAFSSMLRDAITRNGSALIHLDLLPDWSEGRVLAAVTHPRGSRSWASHLQGKLGIEGVKAGLLRECLSKEEFADPARLAVAIKALPVRLTAPRPIDEAISSAGGVCFDALDERLMIKSLPGIFCAGEMLDWEAPTGGYLLTACFASGRVAGQGMLDWLAQHPVRRVS